MAIFFFSEKVNFQFKNKLKYRSWIKCIIQDRNFLPGDINIIFTSDEYLLKINQKYLNHNYFTDIITFNYNVQNIISGDIYISIDTVEDNSKQLNIHFVEELNRVIAHGIMHLAGFKDSSESEKNVMRVEENKCLKRLREYGL